MGVKSKTIHSLSQALGTGVVFLELQLKEYTAAFLTFRDSIFNTGNDSNVISDYEGSIDTTSKKEKVPTAWPLV
eukprot:TRINITY_DN3182_c0_g2_i1.p1 TRINITY_DN3182_c0_g2~~TRINITY_DN3182_c0_g2_i1.p1  ORF type:complete len:74 (-),score=14.22 TRINITY_DN3182_c0_g2_i1:27-248(-)